MANSPLIARMRGPPPSLSVTPHSESLGSAILCLLSLVVFYDFGVVGIASST